MKKNLKRKDKNSLGINYRKGFAMKDAPLYSQDDFLYYFENRLNQIVKNEVDVWIAIRICRRQKRIMR